MANLIGQQLGNYRLLRLLGRGGFAEVYLAQHVYLQRRVALKVLHTSLSDQEVDPFLAEAQTLARLAHPHIVPVFDFAVEDGVPFLVMDYAPRGALRQIHPRGSCLSLATTAAYVKQVAAALQYAHNHQVIHRDVKPENMLCGSQQEILLSDFGLALLAPSPEQVSTQEMAGSLPYMAPEQIRGKPDFASDQYALAIVAYEWLTGVRPFEGTPWEVAYQHVSVEPPRLREKDPSLPLAVEAVVLKALAKNPQDRYVSVQLFAQALERACGRSQPDHNGAVAAEGTGPLVALSPERAPISKHIFLAAAPADAALVARLRADLQQQGVAVWNEDPVGAHESGDQQDRAHQAIRAVDLVVLVVSSQTRASRPVKEYLRIAGLYQRRLVFVWMEGQDVAPLLLDAGGTGRMEVIDARQGRYSLALDELLACLRQDTVVEEPVVADLPFEPRNPYKGLRAFTQADAADFFGRDALIEDLVDRLKDLLGTTRSAAPRARLLPLLGASGSGKSSLVMAGLLPHLQQGVLPASEHWVYLEPMVPGSHPLETLALKLAACFPERSVKSIRQDLEDESARGLHLLACRLIKAADQKVVLLVDQFEEVLTLTTEEERAHFLELLLTAMTEPDGPVIMLLTLRADFYDRLGASPMLGRLIVEQQVVVWPMEPEDLRAVIKRPAALPDVQLSFEGNLVGDLLSEVQGQVGALPLLAFTLSQLFERRRGHHLTLSAYREIGGVKGALAKHAEDTYRALPSEEHRQLARALFLRLIDPGTTEQDTTRRRAALSELLLPTPQQTELLQQVASAFLAARLLTTNEVAQTPTIEVSHEALIREWARLSEWLYTAREDIERQQSISENATDWIRQGQPRDRLYRGAQLTEAQQWAERNIPSQHELAFLQAAAAEREHQEALEHRRQVREKALNRRLRIVAGALAILLVISLITSVLALQKTREANQQAQEALSQANLALSRQLLTQASGLQNNQPDIAFLLELEALHRAPATAKQEARAALATGLSRPYHLATRLTGHTDAVYGVAFSPDGKTLASASRDKTVRLWDVATGQPHGQPLTGHTDTVYSVAFSPDGKTLASASRDTTVRLWDVASGLPRGQPLTGHTDMVWDVAFSPDGKTLASASRDATVRLWDVATGQPRGQPLTGHTGPVTSVAFSPDGKTLASASLDTTVRLWDVASGQPRGQPLTGHTDTVWGVAFSPDGKTLASASMDKTVRLWDVASGQPRGQPLTGHTGPVWVVAFSPDGKTLASASDDKTVRLWDVATGQPRGQPLTGHTDGVTSVAFSPDGKMLASVSYDKTVRLWKVAEINMIERSLTGHTDGVTSVAFSPDGRTLASASFDKTVRLWDVASGLPRGQPLTGHTDTVTSVAFSPDGKTLASVSYDTTVRLWDVASGLPRGQPLTGHTGPVTSVAFSPDGKTLASASVDKTVRLWDVATGQPRGQPLTGHTDTVTSVAFSPDGKTLAEASVDKTVRLWDVASGQPRGQPLTGHIGPVTSVAFSPDGKTLASASDDTTVRLWDVASGLPRGQPLTDHTATVWGVAFSPDGKTLASASDDTTVRLWDVASGQPRGQPLTSHTGPVWGVAFSPDGKTLASASLDKTVRLWDLRIQSWISGACRIATRNLSPS